MSLGHSRIQRFIAASLLATTPACMATYRVAPEYIATHAPDQMLIMDNTGTLHVIEGPTLKGDTVVGIESGTPDTLTLPVSEIEDGLVRRPSKGRTIALVSGLTVGVGAAAIAVITQGAGRPCQSAGNKKDNADPLGTNTCNTHGADGEN